MGPKLKRKRSRTAKAQLFTKDKYTKPPISHRVIGRASVVWSALKDLDLSKPVYKWTIKQKQEYIKVMNNYSCITTIDDPGTERGNLYEIVQRVNSHVCDEDDEEMRTWLDPDYITVDWTGSGVPQPHPNLATIIPPLSPTIPLVNTAHTQCYLVPNEQDAEYLLGAINTRWPGIVGFHCQSVNPLLFRS